MFALGLGVLVVGAWVFIKDRKAGLPLRPRYFGWMAAESLLYAVVIAAIVSRTVQFVFAVWALPAAEAGWSATLLAAGPQAAQEIGLGRMLALSLGAGLYEELVFRVVLVGGLFWILSRFTPRRKVAYVGAALVGAALFSAVHYIGAFGDPFAFPSFAFRFLFGLALNGLFLARGFGVAAWTHAIYDVLVVTHLLG
jgi:membrane protease YdiL (CAAX protease family)